MVIQPKVRGFICTVAHPAGCHEAVKRQIEYVQSQPAFSSVKNALVIGCSTGYGLASRIALSFGGDAKTMGVCFEKPAQGKRTATAGWYNTAAFEVMAHANNQYAKTINGDAFSTEIKKEAAEQIRRDFGKLECLVYSLASPRRTHPESGQTYASVLKPIGQSYSNKTVDPLTGVMKDITLEPASDEEINNTVEVMGGDDWERWVAFLQDEDLLAENFTTIGYSYIGPEITFPIYTAGTIGMAKKHMQQTAESLTKRLASLNGKALISVNKALVTQSSSAIPVVPLYMSILFEIMEQKGTNEHCIEQMQRLFSNYYSNEAGLEVDSEGRLRMDDWEMHPEVQSAVADQWSNLSEDMISSLPGLKMYQTDFYRLFGFGFDNIDYSADVDPVVEIPSLIVSSQT